MAGCLGFMRNDSHSGIDPQRPLRRERSTATLAAVPRPFKSTLTSMSERALNRPFAREPNSVGLTPRETSSRLGGRAGKRASPATDDASFPGHRRQPFVKESPGTSAQPAAQRTNMLLHEPVDLRLRVQPGIVRTRCRRATEGEGALRVRDARQAHLVDPDDVRDRTELVGHPDRTFHVLIVETAQDGAHVTHAR